MKHLVIGQFQKPAKFSAFQLVTILKSGFYWSAFGNQQGSTFTETNRNGLIHHIGCLITLSDRNGPILDQVYSILTIFLALFQPVLADLITESDTAVRAVHSCKSWLWHSCINELMVI